MFDVIGNERVDLFHGDSAALAAGLALAGLGRAGVVAIASALAGAQTNTYDPRRPGATSSLLSCRRSQTLVGALVPAVVMSGVVDSGRPRGHGNVDGNHPKRTWTLHPASLGSIKGEDAARHPFVWPVRHHPPRRKHL
jgi:hypothetical protein